MLQIRPIDKKQQYQIQKLTNTIEIAKGNVTVNEESSKKSEKKSEKMSEDISKYRPNPDMLVSKLDNLYQVSDCNDIDFRNEAF